MWTLVLNSGSSSLKFALLNPASGEVRLSGLAERLGTPEATIQLEHGGQQKSRSLGGGSSGGESYEAALGEVLRELETLGMRGAVRAVGHRVVHGGERFSAPVLVTPEVLEAVRACVPLAPLHNPANIVGIEAAQQAFPKLPHVAVFDTAFHQTMPEVAYRYAVPEAWYTVHGVRRYGFHGTSHAYVAGKAAEMLQRPLPTLNLITAHLGNGASVCAVAGGQSMDTSMGLTPLEGLIMGSRSGDVDPGLHDYLARQAGLSLSEITAALNKESGLLGLSGLTNDMRELEKAALTGHRGARLALGAFIYRLAKCMAGMAVALGRVDGVVFTGGIGENSRTVRAQTLRRLGVLGLHLDEEANKALPRGDAGVISLPGGPVALVIPTHEELMIARETAVIVGGRGYAL